MFFIKTRASTYSVSLSLLGWEGGDRVFFFFEPNSPEHWAGSSSGESFRGKSSWSGVHSTPPSTYGRHLLLWGGKQKNENEREIVKRRDVSWEWLCFKCFLFVQDYSLYVHFTLQESWKPSLEGELICTLLRVCARRLWFLDASGMSQGLWHRHDEPWDCVSVICIAYWIHKSRSLSITGFI